MSLHISFLHTAHRLPSLMRRNTMHAVSTVIAMTLTAATATAQHADSLPHADSAHVELTVDALHRMATFWTAFAKEAPAIRDTGSQAHQKQINLGFSITGMNIALSGVDMIAMAHMFPTVAADLRVAGLTAQRWEGYRNALMAVSTVEQFEHLEPSLTIPVHQLPLWKNVLFIRAHRQDYEALLATGMSFPKLVGGVMGGGVP